VSAITRSPPVGKISNTGWMHSRSSAQGRGKLDASKTQRAITTKLEGQIGRTVGEPQGSRSRHSESRAAVSESSLVGGRDRDGLAVQDFIPVRSHATVSSRRRARRGQRSQVRYECGGCQMRRRSATPFGKIARP